MPEVEHTGHRGRTTPEVAETSPASIQKHSLDGYTVGMPPPRGAAIGRGHIVSPRDSLFYVPLDTK